MTINPKRGEIWQVNLEPTIGQEIRKKRPVVVISSDLYSPIALRTVIPLTTWQNKFVDFSTKVDQVSFTASAEGSISSAKDLDVWTIDQNKTLKNNTAGF
jgi:mRNA interferase MazF